MKLLKYRVTNFRSVVDSGWIDVGDITTLIGVNESGKTNLLIPLWKLNPAGTNVGGIDPIADYPRSKFYDIRAMETKPVFIQAHFELELGLPQQLSKLTGHPAEELRVADVRRRFDGTYMIGFPNATVKDCVDDSTIEELLVSAHSEIAPLTTTTTKEPEVKDSMLATLERQLRVLREDDDDGTETLGREEIGGLITELKKVDLSDASPRSAIKPRFEQLIGELEAIRTDISKPHPKENTEARNLVRSKLLTFVYYAHYGNLDSKIYLPHVIADMGRAGLGTREEAKARTLKVLFEFVKLQPQEILDLGHDPHGPETAMTPEEVEATSEKREERSILLSSASAALTRQFKDWWKQGEYKFDFRADGDFFRIEVSDALRPEPIELENRSSGLQWFFSFYLVFLVERSGSHQNAMLLLDEPGLTLHPLAERELSAFFTNLAVSNQIMFTTHSPFMVDADYLDRVRSVYVDTAGHTVISSDLRARESDPSQSKSIYAVHAALGLSVSDVLLEGCRAVIVEGPSDQLYLSAMKIYLISKGLIKPAHELLFMPAGGAKGVAPIAAIVTGHNGARPYALLDSDKQGDAKAASLRSGIYQDSPTRVVQVGTYVAKPGAEVEDLSPFSGIAQVISRELRGRRDDFHDSADESKTIVPQVESWAKDKGVELKIGWKVEVAKAAKERLELGKLEVPPGVEEIWKRLFEQLLSD